MEKETKSRIDEAVPAPEAAAKLSEAEKRALEISGQVEHAHGKKRDDLAKQAEDLAGDGK